MSRSTLPRHFVLACLFACASACSGPPVASMRDPSVTFDLDATRLLIAEQNTRFTSAHLSGDVATIDSMFSSDPKSYPPGSAPVIGLAALHAFTVEYIKAGLTEFREESTDFYGNAEYVVDAGSYVVTYGPDHVTERGKYLNVWQQVDGSWKLKTNMWNTDAPASK